MRAIFMRESYYLAGMLGHARRKGTGMQEAKKGAFDGLLVLDFTAMIAGPHCTRLLADLGARVIKLEPPEGDYMRSRGPLRDGFSAYYASLNCGKQSLCLDLKKDAARTLVLELAAKADVVVENFRPGVAARLGFGYEALAATNPALVYCSISGYGQSGSYAQRPAYAPIVHAASGYEMATLDYQDGLDRPLKSGIFTADILSGVNAFGGISAALYRRARTGLGEYVDVTLMDSMLGLMVYECQEAQFPQPERRPVYRATKAKDGFVILAPVSQANFEALAKAAGRPDWLRDERFAAAGARGRNWEALMQVLDDWGSTRSAADIERDMLAAGVPCSRYLSVREAMETPYTGERGSFTRAKDGGGEFLAPNPAFRMRNADTSAKPFVDAAGAHNRDVVGGLLQRDVAQLQRLYDDGVLCGQQ